MIRDQTLAAARSSCAGSRQPTPHSPGRAPRGLVGGREPGTHTADGRASHRQPHPAWREVNQMRRPSLEELQRQLEEHGGCEAIDGCFVEPDGTCDHGHPSWLLVLGLI